ncbi:MAG: hypothetical protein R3E89_11695 [Thiolinea sp.]
MPNALTEFFANDLVVNTLGGLLASIFFAVLGFLWLKHTRKPHFTGKTNDIKLPASDNQLFGREAQLLELDQSWRDKTPKSMYWLPGLCG